MKKNILFFGFILLLAASCSKSDVEIYPAGEDNMKYATAAQKEWMQLKYGMFIHFGPNTIQKVPWGNGTYPAWLLNFSTVDPDQWARVAKDAGMKYAVLTTKHHDGFCLWPSAFTAYCTKSTLSPGVDIVRRFVDAFRAAGLRVGLYYSLWDRNNPEYYGSNDFLYVDYMKNQLTELLTGYGEIDELWFDGAWDRDYPHACQNDTLMALFGLPVLPVNSPVNPHSICWMYSEKYQEMAPLSIHGQRWAWKEIYTLIHQLQPNCMVINNASMNWKGGVKYLPMDVRSVEQFDFVLPTGFVRYDDIAICVYSDAMGTKHYLPLEFTTSITPEWFWTGDFLLHPSVDEIVGWFRNSRKHSGNFLLNVGPNAEGRIPEYNHEYLKKAGDILRSTGELP
jgi:alpha-L-fucosidase